MGTPPRPSNEDSGSGLGLFATTGGRWVIHLSSYGTTPEVQRHPPLRSLEPSPVPGHLVPIATTRGETPRLGNPGNDVWVLRPGVEGLGDRIQYFL